MSKLEITLVKSTANCSSRQRKIAESLGLRKINSSITKEDTPDIRGKISKIKHLLSVKETDA